MKTPLEELIEEKKKELWSTLKFYKYPVIARIALMDRYEADLTQAHALGVKEGYEQGFGDGW